RDPARLRTGSGAHRPWPAGARLRGRPRGPALGTRGTGRGGRPVGGRRRHDRQHHPHAGLAVLVRGGRRRRSPDPGTRMTRLPASVRASMLVRSLAVQGSWNFETLVGAGFAFTLLPALRFIYGRSGPELDAAVSRHADLFNSHPYFATVAVGSVARLEAEKVEPVVVDRFKSALRGSLGSMGDRLVWTCWRPMSVLIGMVLFLLGAAWWVALAVLLIVYNLLHFAVRL